MNIVHPPSYFFDGTWCVTLPGWDVQDQYTTEEEAYMACDSTWATNTETLSPLQAAHAIRNGMPEGAMEVEYLGLDRWTYRMPDTTGYWAVRQDGVQRYFSAPTYFGVSTVNGWHLLHAARIFATQPPTMWLPEMQAHWHTGGKTDACQVCQWEDCVIEWKSMYSKKSLGGAVWSMPEKYVIGGTLAQYSMAPREHIRFKGIVHPFADASAQPAEVEQREEPPVVVVRDRVKARYAMNTRFTKEPYTR